MGFHPPSGGGGSGTFIGLTDVPAAFTGGALKVVRVNAGETDLEFGAVLGTIATQNSNNVTITGGSVTGITDLVVADGGTGASTFTDAGVLIGNGTGAVQVTTAGTAGQVLTSNGAGVDPTFQAAAGGLTMGVAQSIYMGNAYTFITALS